MASFSSNSVIQFIDSLAFVHEIVEVEMYLIFQWHRLEYLAKNTDMLEAHIIN
jgi:hypothetical protein